MDNQRKLVVALLLACCTGCSTTRQALPATSGEPTAVSIAAGGSPDPARSLAGSSAPNFASALAYVQESEYAFASRGGASVSAPNRAQNLRMSVNRGGVRILPRSSSAAPWMVHLQVTGVGRAGALTGVREVQPVARGNRVSLARDDFLEWYQNDARGIEQGFTMPQPPASGASDAPVMLELTYSADLTVSLSDDGERLTFAKDGQPVLLYAGLAAWDAAHRALPARIVIQPEHRLALQVDDRGAAYPITIDPLLTTPAWTAEGNAANRAFGRAVASAGDVNRDGCSDVIIGAPYYDTGAGDGGKVFVFLGSPSGLNPTPNWQAEGLQPGADFGEAVASAGDVNGDGFGDIVVGASRYDNGEIDEGVAFVWLGGDMTGVCAPAGTPSGLGACGTPANADWTAESNQAGARLGDAVVSAGDINGDRASELLVGAEDFDNGQADEGAAFVWLGSAAGLGPNGTPANADWRAESDQVSASLGESVGAGDFNKDTFSDILIGGDQYDNGQTNEGIVFLWYGGAAGLGPNGTPFNADWFAESDQTNAGLGKSTAGAGDTNGDGIADVLVGAPAYDNGHANEGRVFLWYGSTTGLGPSGNPVNADWRAESDQSDARLGESVAGTGNVNGDGLSGVMAGAPLYNNGQTDEGAVFAWYGSPLGPNLGVDGTPANADWVTEGNQTDAHYGTAVAAAGSVNCDTCQDVVIGAPYFDNGQTDEGAAYAYLSGGCGPLSVTWDYLRATCHYDDGRYAGILVEWAAFEDDTIGYIVQRAPAETGPYVDVSPYIAARGSSFPYSWLDARPLPATLNWYRVQEFDTSGYGDLSPPFTTDRICDEPMRCGGIRPEPCPPGYECVCEGGPRSVNQGGSGTATSTTADGVVVGDPDCFCRPMVRLPGSLTVPSNTSTSTEAGSAP